jgi:hypothetical protein
VARNKVKENIRKEEQEHKMWTRSTDTRERCRSKNSENSADGKKVQKKNPSKGSKTFFPHISSGSFRLFCIWDFLFSRVTFFELN